MCHVDVGTQIAAAAETFAALVALESQAPAVGVPFPGLVRLVASEAADPLAAGSGAS